MAVLRAAMSYPQFRLAIDVPPWVGQDETIWLGRTTVESDAISRWIVLDAEGFPLREVELPVSARVLWSGEESLRAVELDEQKVPWLVGYRVRVQ